MNNRPTATSDEQLFAQARAHMEKFSAAASLDRRLWDATVRLALKGMSPPSADKAITDQDAPRVRRNTFVLDDKEVVYASFAACLEREANQLRTSSATKAICPRCLDEWRGQACVADCPLWKMMYPTDRRGDK